MVEIRRSIAAGVCIGIGCIAYLSVDNRYVGAFLFSIGLMAVCVFRLNLFTGKVCYLEYLDERRYELIFIG